MADGYIELFTPAYCSAKRLKFLMKYLILLPPGVFNPATLLDLILGMSPGSSNNYAETFFEDSE